MKKFLLPCVLVFPAGLMLASNTGRAQEHRSGAVLVVASQDDHTMSIIDP